MTINAFDNFRNLKVEDSSKEESNHEVNALANASDEDSDRGASRVDSNKSDSDNEWMAGHDLAANDSNSNGKLEHVINYFFSFSKLVRARKVAGSRRPHSNSAEEPLIPIVFVTIKKWSKKIMLKALLDSGAGALLIAEKHCTDLKTIAKKASFKTVAGKFYTAGVVKTAFKLAELNPTAKVDYKLHVVNTLGVYNMILGRDV